MLSRLTSIAPAAAMMCPNSLFGGEVDEFDIVGARLRGEVMEELIVEEGERYE